MIRFGYHPTLNVIQISQDDQIVFVRRDQATAFLAGFMRILAESAAPEAPVIEADTTEIDNWSRKVSDTPALRLVGSFSCDPDPSCGQEAS